MFEPHTYSRTKLLFNEFISALSCENLVIYKTFSARENYDYSGSAERLAQSIKNAEYVDSFSGLLKKINGSWAKNIVVLGAGELYSKFSEEIKKLTP